MAGMGLDPQGQSLTVNWKDPVAAKAPSAHLIMWVLVAICTLVLSCETCVSAFSRGRA